MTEKYTSFPEEIEHNQSETEVPVETIELSKGESALSVRLRGCFITDLTLTDPSTGKAKNILNSEKDKNKAKLTASHIMSPIGKYEGIGGQHGFARWADYHEFPLIDGENGEKRVSFQAKRSDNGLGLYKFCELQDNCLTSETVFSNNGPETENTSIGEHFYFALENESLDGLLLNGSRLDEILGEGSEDEIIEGKSFDYPQFDGEAIIDFPDGHSVILSASSPDGDLDMLIWHRKGSNSICFEPTVGFSKETGNAGLQIEPNASASLSTKIELLPSDLSV